MFNLFEVFKPYLIPCKFYEVAIIYSGINISKLASVLLPNERLLRKKHALGAECDPKSLLFVVEEESR